MRRWLALAGGALALACASTQSLAPKTEPMVSAAAAPAAAAEPVEEPLAPPPAPQESAGFVDALAALRPVAGQEAVSALAAAPGDAARYAQAALAYAGTDVPGMALIWGMTYGAMGGGAEDAKVSAAVVKVLTERISVKRTEQSDEVAFNLRLAPGQMPTRQHPDGSVEAPVAHVFEALFGSALTGFRPPWDIEQFYDALSSWAALIDSRGTPLDEAVPLDAWLVDLAKAGHLEAYCHQLLGPALPAELKAYKRTHATELKAFKDYLSAARLVPARAPLPDQLVRVK